jgi:hypothetical protein
MILESQTNGLITWQATPSNVDILELGLGMQHSHLVHWGFSLLRLRNNLA